MDGNHGIDGTWRGAFITVTLWIFSSVTLSQVALGMTILSASLTMAYTVYKWRRNK
jgi:hypothetical protein